MIMIMIIIIKIKLIIIMMMYYAGVCTWNKLGYVNDDRNETYAVNNNYLLLVWKVLSMIVTTE